MASASDDGTVKIWELKGLDQAICPRAALTYKQQARHACVYIYICICVCRFYFGDWELKGLYQAICPRAALTYRQQARHACVNVYVYQGSADANITPSTQYT